MSPTFERQLGPMETSYFLPSRELGVNDMILHLGFKAPFHLIGKHRVALSWAILRTRHPLLASRIQMNDYDDIRFVYTSPASAEESLRDANDSIRYVGSIDVVDYLNGHRVLSDTRLSCIFLTYSPALPSPPLSPSESAIEPYDVHNYDILIAATHYIGDGISLHTLSNDFFSVLGNESLSDHDLMVLLEKELCDRWWGDKPQGLPPSLEDRLPPLPTSNAAFRKLVARVDFDNSQRQQIGGHIFPKRTGGSRSIVIRRNIIEEERNKKMLKTCKSHGVSISSALFALCNITWVKTRGDQLSRELPIMIYSAINLRPYLHKQPSDTSYHFVSMGYFNVVLPSFFPLSPETQTKAFWHRAKLARDQSINAGKNPMLASRQREMARFRAERAKIWAREDDESCKPLSAPITPLPSHTTPSSFPFATTTTKTLTSAAPVAPPQSKPSTTFPSICLMGASLMGNLDAIYKHASYPSVKLHTMSGAMRQRPGGMVLFAYTFAGKLWVDLVYDENAFDRSVVDRFLGEFEKGMEELLEGDC